MDGVSGPVDRRRVLFQRRRCLGIPVGDPRDAAALMNAPAARGSRQRRTSLHLGHRSRHGQPDRAAAPRGIDVFSGILLVNRPLKVDDPRIEEVAPSVLAELGLASDDTLDRRVVW